MRSSTAAGPGEDGLAFDPSIIGHYVGESQEQHATAEGSKPIPGAENIERFELERVQGWVRITGRSFDKTTEKRVQPGMVVYGK